MTAKSGFAQRAGKGFRRLTVWLLACGECGRFVHFKTKSSWKRVRGAIPFLNYSFVKKL